VGHEDRRLGVVNRTGGSSAYDEGTSRLRAHPKGQPPKKRRDESRKNLLILERKITDKRRGGTTNPKPGRPPSARKYAKKDPIGDRIHKAYMCNPGSAVVIEKVCHSDLKKQTHPFRGSSRFDRVLQQYGIRAMQSSEGRSAD